MEVLCVVCVLVSKPAAAFLTDGVPFTSTGASAAAAALDFGGLAPPQARALGPRFEVRKEGIKHFLFYDLVVEV